MQFPSLQNNLTDASRNSSKWEAGSVGDNGEFEEWWPAVGFWMEKSGGKHRPPFLTKWRRKEKQILNS